MSTTEAVSGGDDKNASFYGEDIFDDMIAKVMANSSNGGGNNNNGGLERLPESSTRDSPVNIEIVVENGTHPSYNNDEDGHSVSIDDLEIGEGGGDDDDGSRNTNDDISSTNTGSDAASLDSGEISGESDISEVENREKSYVPQPLVNDDESTIAMKDPSPETQTVSSYVDQLNQQERRKSRLIKLGGFAILIAIIVAVILAVVMLNGNKDAEDDSNNSSSVSNPTFGDIDASMNTSSTPTMQPIKLGSPIATVHPVQLTLEGIPDGYRLPEDDRTSIISFLDTLIEDNLLRDEYLGDSFEVVEVAYGREGGGLPNRGPSSRRLQLMETLYLPLRIVVAGPSNFSEVAVRSKIIQVITDQTRNIEAYLRAYDYDAFESVGLSAETYDMDDLIEPTSSPTLPPQSEQPTTASPTTAPQTNKPTLSPSQSPSIKPMTRPPTAPKTSRPTTFSPVTNEPTTAPVTSSPTKNPTPQPSLNPTNRPTFPPVTPRPTLRPSRRPTARPISPTTPIAPYGSANSQPSTVSNPTPPSSGINQGPIAPLPVGTSNTYYCAKTSYTANWNILLDFDCELPCPSTIHTECPGGYQCHVSDYCSEVDAR